MCSVRETNILSFHSGHKKNLQRESSLKVSFLSVRFHPEFDGSWRSHIFRKKKMCLFPFTFLHSNHWRRHWKLTCSVPSEDLLSFTPLVKKRGALSVPSCTWPSFSVLTEEKGVTGTIDPTAFHLVIIRQDVCFGGRYVIALNLLFHCLKHTHKAY